jgi:hypothetical protein
MNVAESAAQLQEHVLAVEDSGKSFLSAMQLSNENTKEMASNAFSMEQSISAMASNLAGASSSLKNFNPDLALANQAGLGGNQGFLDAIGYSGTSAGFTNNTSLPQFSSMGGYSRASSRNDNSSLDFMKFPEISGGLFKNMTGLDMATQEELSRISMQVTMNPNAAYSKRRVSEMTANGQYGSAVDELARSSQNQYWDAWKSAYSYGTTNNNKQLQESLLSVLEDTTKQGSSGYWDAWKEAYSTAQINGDQNTLDRLDYMDTLSQVDKSGTGPLDSGRSDSSAGSNSSRSSKGNGKGLESMIGQLYDAFCKQFGSEKEKPYFEDKLPIPVLS